MKVSLPPLPLFLPGLVMGKRTMAILVVRALLRQLRTAQFGSRAAGEATSCISGLRLAAYWHRGVTCCSSRRGRGRSTEEQLQEASSRIQNAALSLQYVQR